MALQAASLIPSSVSFHKEGKFSGFKETSFVGISISDNLKSEFHPSSLRIKEAFSTPLFPLDILEDRPPEAKVDWKLLAKYGSLVSFISIVALFVYLIASPSSAARASKRKH